MSSLKGFINSLCRLLVCGVFARQEEFSLLTTPSERKGGMLEPAGVFFAHAHQAVSVYFFGLLLSEFNKMENITNQVTCRRKKSSLTETELDTSVKTSDKRINGCEVLGTGLPATSNQNMICRFHHPPVATDRSFQRESEEPNTMTAPSCCRSSL